MVPSRRRFLSRRRFPCGMALERAVEIDVSSADFSAKKFCGGVLVENAADDFPQQKKLDFAENFANFTLEIAAAYL